ncbi:MAG: electron transport complex subunit RsxC [Candidatus Hydrogenedentes bacterium]|nr:electron transport complex subunit RsxC [Candidatus Hydrogenedentota bacterium]
MKRFLGFGSRKTFSHGVHPPEAKELTQAKAIRRLPFAPEFIIPLSQHTGAPARPIVREGQEVVRGEPIAEAGGFVSVPMHAPVSGVILKIGLARDVRGGMSPAIIVRQYPGASQEILYGTHVDVDTLAPAEIVKAVQNTGVVGLGGAAFPTHVKLAVPDNKRVDTIIVNGCECEPYLTTDHRIMLERAGDLFEGIRIVKRAMSAERVIIGVEHNKLDAVEHLRATKPAGLDVAIEVVEAKYPQGAEKMLSKALVNREVPSGKLPVDVGVAVFNVATLSQIGELLPRKQGLIERVVTVSGPSVSRPGNYLVALGTPLRFVLEQVGFDDPDAQFLFGGPMMGVSVGSVDVPVTKGVTGILVFPRGDSRLARDKKEFGCIKCGSCIQACPMHLNPSTLGLLAKKQEYDMMAEQYHLMDCFECGCCSYVCPSNIPLVQHFRVAKSVVRDRKVSAS